jgi:uncharacterized protein YbjQ (UPF0145 family)
MLGHLAGGIQSFFGGNITICTELCEHARSEAFALMVEHAQQMGANAIIGMRYDANDTCTARSAVQCRWVMEGITEVLAYGTAVVAERI